MFGLLGGLLGGGGGSGGAQTSSAQSNPVSSVSFARGREGATPTPEWVAPVLAIAGIVLLAGLAWFITRK